MSKKKTHVIVKGWVSNMRSRKCIGHATRLYIIPSLQWQSTNFVQFSTDTLVAFSLDALTKQQPSRGFNFRKRMSRVELMNIWFGENTQILSHYRFRKLHNCPKKCPSGLFARMFLLIRSKLTFLDYERKKSKKKNANKSDFAKLDLSFTTEF